MDAHRLIIGRHSRDSETERWVEVESDCFYSISEGTIPDHLAIHHFNDSRATARIEQCGMSYTEIVRDEGREMLGWLVVEKELTISRSPDAQA